jgi:hypothetical protein
MIVISKNLRTSEVFFGYISCKDYSLQKYTFCHSAACGGIPFKLILRDIDYSFLISGGEKDLYEMTKKEQNQKIKVPETSSG